MLNEINLYIWPTPIYIIVLTKSLGFIQLPDHLSEWHFSTKLSIIPMLNSSETPTRPAQYCEFLIKFRSWLEAIAWTTLEFI